MKFIQKKIFNFRIATQDFSIRGIDLILMGLFACSLFFIFFFFKRNTTTIDVTYKITNDHPLFASESPSIEYAQSFKVGDIEYSEVGIVESEIMAVDSFQVEPAKLVTYVKIRIKAVYNPRKKLYYFRGKPISYGITQKFYFTNVYFEGLVVDYPGYIKNSKKGKAIVEAELLYENRSFSDVYGVKEYIANNLTEGEEIKDSEGNVLVKILKIEKTPAKRTVVLANGTVSSTIDPSLFDVKMTLEINTQVINSKHYQFRYLPLLVGEIVPLTLKKISVWPTITKIIETSDL